MCEGFESRGGEAIGDPVVWAERLSERTGVPCVARVIVVVSKSLSWLRRRAIIHASDVVFCGDGPENEASTPL